MHGYHEKNILETKFPFRLFVNEGNGNVPHHWHEEVEIIYITKGSTKAGINNKVYELTKGDILIIAPGEVHYFWRDTGYDIRVVVQYRMNIYDNALSGDNDTKEIKPMFFKSYHLKRGSDLHKLLEKQIQGLVDECASEDDGYKLMLKARLYDLAAILIRNMPKGKYNEEKISKQKERLKRLDIIQQYVERNYQTPITLEEIANEAGFSKYHFTRFFKESTGITFIDYLTKYRITKAEWYLTNDEDSVTEIALKSGFNSIKTFNRVFKNINGCSPMEYKKRLMA